MKYFVTSLPVSQNIGTFIGQTTVLDEYKVNDEYWKQAEIKLSGDVEWITQDDLYKKVKCNDGSGDEIILSKPVRSVFEAVQSDFPNANIWVYE